MHVFSMLTSKKNTSHFTLCPEEKNLQTNSPSILLRKSLMSNQCKKSFFCIREGLLLGMEDERQWIQQLAKRTYTTLVSEGESALGIFEFQAACSALGIAVSQNEMQSLLGSSQMIGPQEFSAFGKLLTICND